MDFTWRLRPQGEYYDPEDIYGDEPRVFSVKINHGGEFTDYPGREYVNGKVSYIDWVEFDKFSVDVLREMLKDIGYSVDDVFNFFVKDPNVCLDFGLRHFTDDDELDYVYDQLRKGCKLVDLYVEIGESRIKDSTVMSLALLDNVGEDNVVEDESESSEAVSEGESESSDKENSDEEDPDYTFGQEPDNPVFDYEVDMSQFKACVDFDPDEVNETIRDARNENTVEELRQEDITCDHEDFSDKDDNCTLLEKVAKKVRKKRKITGNVSDSYLPFSIGQLIPDKKQLNDMVKTYAVKSRRQIYILKNDKLRFRVICLGTNPTLGSTEGQNSKFRGVGLKQDKRHLKPTCPWAVQISRRTEKESWCVKTITSQHHCLQTREVGLYTMSQIAKEIQPMIESNPDMPLPAIQDMLVKNHQLNVSIQKVFRAKRIATTRIIGDYREQYGILRSYCEALLRANPGSTIIIDCEPCANPSLPTRQFKRCYVCFASIMRGFKMCGREILGLDGCFMKGPFPGQILTAVGVDGNNGIYPVAYALVEAETFKSWEWFLELLKDDLGLGDSTNIL
ncbi:putative MULE transposase domain-containing protein [Helianthus annuus]|uniref:uncharacterized protein LOC118492577 n=1 Tax=Helianthus annuus TaxID=4232 RepID=UPI001652ED8F|nr:uncharacterized protein LOC118492577 [Helianthus annuus]KAJ0569446.1 putative MULE transposase domain-containing protein [Helianthus annuus]KAJ0583754.1 putative MULE transposase domain-containing protein [Helianthus annuus]KAJ0917973.1 putative MULE transposase domain-containing protein [Helianthus annuus]